MKAGVSKGKDWLLKWGELWLNLSIMPKCWPSAITYLSRVEGGSALDKWRGQLHIHFWETRTQFSWAELNCPSQFNLE